MPQDRPTILVVDDEPPIRTALSRIVSRQGCLPVEAASAQEALALVESVDTPMAVICDFNMPGMTGVELARELRARFPGIPVLLLSGGILDPEIREAMDAGELWAYVTKPWNLAWMKEAIGAMVRGEAPP